MFNRRYLSSLEATTPRKDFHQQYYDSLTLSDAIENFIFMWKLNPTDCFGYRDERKHWKYLNFSKI